MNNWKDELYWARRLYEAVEQVDIRKVKHLVSTMGADPDVILPECGISVFHLAVGVDAISFSKEVTGLFLAAGGNPNVRCSEGVTPVHVASMRGRAENLKLLLLAGGDPLAVDDDGFSSLDYATQHNHLSCIDVIQKYCGYRSPAFGQFNVSETKPSESKNLHASSPKEFFHKGGQLVVASDSRNIVYRPLLDVKQFNPESYNEGLFEQRESNFHLNQFVDAEADVISESNRSDDCAQIIEYVDYLLGRESANVRPSKIPDETFSVHSSPQSGYVNYLQHAGYPVTPDNEGNVVRDGSKNGKENTPVGSRTWTFSVCESPFYPWSNFYAPNDGSIERGPSPLSSITDSCHGYRMLNANRILFAKLSPHLSPSQKETIPWYHLEGIRSACRRKDVDSSREISSDFSVSCPDLPKKFNEEKFQNITTRRKVSRRNRMSSRLYFSSDSESGEYFTVPEDTIEITDEENGIVFEEKRLETPILAGQVIPLEGKSFPVKSIDFLSFPIVCKAVSTSSLSSCRTYDISRELHKVVSCGCSCPTGPVTVTTKKVYAKVIKKFKVGSASVLDSQLSLPQVNTDSKFSRALEDALRCPSKVDHGKYFELEQKMTSQFDGNEKYCQWRGGVQKTSFNYLLLDPRVTLNLPSRWARNGSLGESFFSSESSRYWREFLSSIFYVGKGKRSQSYTHLCEAVTAWRSNDGNVSKRKNKVKRIFEIWQENLGVVCLHLFQNAIPAEAMTREAAMIDAIGLKNLTNEERGKYYGLISTLGFSEKRSFGSFLLHRALVIFLAEGEKQIKPAHLD